MSGILAWFTPAVMRMLAWALLHFLWQGLVLAAVFAGLMAIFRSAATRYVLAVSILVLMVASPVATFLFLRQSSNADAPKPVLAQAGAPQVTRIIRAQTASPQLEAGTGISPDTFLWLVRAWIAGVLFFSLRTAGGMFVVERLQHRKAAPVAERLRETCLELQRRVGIGRAIRFCQCNGLDVPAVVGWLRPVVLLPMTVLTGLSEAQLEAVIVHELAHIKRGDYFVNLFQMAAETLLFYHPAVWWVSGRIRRERENCCDDVAVLVCGNVTDYARALTYMEGGRTAPAFAMAASGSPLAARVMRLLGNRKSGESMITGGLVLAAVCLAGGVFLSQAFVRVAHAGMKPASLSAVHADATPAPAAAAKVATAPASEDAASTPADMAQPAIPVHPVVDVAQVESPQAVATPVVEPVSPAEPLPVPQATPGEQSAGNTTSYVESLKAMGFDHLSVDELIAMKVQGVTAGYIRDLQAVGLKPDADELIALRVQGVTSDYVRSLQAEGIKLDADELVGMKVQGVTPEYIRQLQDLGLKPDADELMAMRVQHVTPEYIHEIRALGLNPTSDELVAMHIQGVTPAYVQALKASGLAKANVDDYIAAKVQDITPEFIEKAHQHGFQNLTVEQLIELKHMGVM